MVTLDPTYDGDVEVKDHGIEVTKADPHIRVSLSLLMSATRGIQLVGNSLIFGSHQQPTSYTSYEIVGWDGNGSLLCDRTDPPIPDDGGEVADGD